MDNLEPPDGFEEAHDMGEPGLMAEFFADRDDDGNVIVPIEFDEREDFDALILPKIQEIIDLCDERQIPFFCVTTFMRGVREVDGGTATGEGVHIVAVALDGPRGGLYQRAFLSVMNAPSEWNIYPSGSALWGNHKQEDK